MKPAVVSRYGMASAAEAYGPAQMLVAGQSVFIADSFVSHGFDGPEEMAVVQLKQGFAPQYVFPMANLEDK